VSDAEPLELAPLVLFLSGMTVSAAKPLPIGSHLKHDARGLIQLHDHGPAVAELQKALKAAGEHVTVDSNFGAETDAAVRAFQTRTHIKVDGIVGPQTLNALEKFKAPAPHHAPHPIPAPGHPTDPHLVDPRHSAEWNKYAKMVKSAGGQLNPGGKPTVLGIRKGNGATHSYSDEFVVLLKNGQVKHFTGSTRPGQSSSTLAEDWNHDGVGDVAELRPGNYYATSNGDHHGKPSFHVHPAGDHGSDRVAAYRDFNHDGFFSAAEKAESRRLGVTAGQILFHVGFSTPSSIGCQNLMPSNVDAFVRSVGGSGGSFSYTLVDR